MLALKALMDRFCEPHSSTYSDSHTKKHLQMKNRAAFVLLMALFILVFIRTLVGGFSVTHFVIGGQGFVVFTAFFLFARTKPYILDLTVTLVVSTSPLLCLLDPYYGTIRGMATALCQPSWLLLIDKNLKSFTLSSIMVFVIMQFIVKPQMPEVIAAANPQQFVDDYFINFRMVFVSHFCIILFLQKNLRDTNEKLNIAQTEIEKAYEKLKGFIHTFSHELRNPLNTVLGNIHLLMMESLVPKIKERVQSAQIGAEILLQLINNILDSCKAGVVELECHAEAVKLRDLITRIWKIQCEIIQSKGLSGYIKIDNTVPSVLMLDPYRITQVFMNLVGNAVKFTDQGTVSVRISWEDDQKIEDSHFYPEPWDDDGLFEKEENFSYISRGSHAADFLTTQRQCLMGRTSQADLEERVGVLKFIFKDTGCGISKQSLDKIFEQYYQASSDIKQKQKGTGLGLYISKEIIQRMGGEVRTFSQVGIGTIFVVCIPTTSVPLNQSVMRSIKDTTIGLKERQLKIFIADDVSYNVNLLKDYLSGMSGATIEGFSNGKACLKAFLQNYAKRIQTDVIIVDSDMPEMDGKTLIREIRDFERINKAKPSMIIMISGNDLTNIKELLDTNNKYKIQAFLKKPINKQDFLSSLVKTLTELNN